MSVKGYFLSQVGNTIYFRQWYTGAKWRVPASKAYVVNDLGQKLVLAREEDAFKLIK